MKFQKKRISIRTRLCEPIRGLEWLATTTIPVHGTDGKWYESTLDFKERWECFLSCIETAILGYVYGVESE